MSRPRRRPARWAPLAAAVVALVLAATAATARPIRTNTPGTGVFIGSGLLGQVICDQRSRGELELASCELVTDFRYSPATHWVVGIRAPFLLSRTLEGLATDPGSDLETDGLGDVQVSAKYRFFREVGAWFDQHAAVELGVELPTGDRDGSLDPTLAAPLRARLQPGTGALGLFAEVVYQRGQRRRVWGGDLSYRWRDDGHDDYRFGDEARLDLDFEYIAFPRDYRKPGNEIFLLLEGSVVHRQDDEIGGRRFDTGGTEVLLAPGIQHIATDRLLLSFSLQFPLASDLGGAALESDWNALVEFRYAF